jgi:type IV secretory pathway VirB2 component (pilin)
MKIINKILFSLSSLLIASPVFAQAGPGGEAVSEQPPTFSGIDTVLDKVVALIFPVAGIVCVVFIIIGGYTWIASSGDPAKVQQAQGTLTWAIIGLVFVLVAALVVNTIFKFVS